MNWWTEKVPLRDASGALPLLDAIFVWAPHFVDVRREAGALVSVYDVRRQERKGGGALEEGANLVLVVGVWLWHVKNWPSDAQVRCSKCTLT